jgi:hypothetical protein
MRPEPRRHARVALVPLSVIAAVFVLPTYRSCATAPFESPASFATGSVFGALWIAPVFLAAAFFAVLTVRALLSRDVDRSARRLGLGALALVGLTSIASSTFMLGDKNWVDLVMLAASLAAAVLAAALVRRARGRTPWEIWEHLLAAFAVVAAGTGPTGVIASNLVMDAGSDLAPGAYLYLGALALLGLIATRAVTDSPS